MKFNPSFGLAQKCFMELISFQLKDIWAYVPNSYSEHKTNNWVRSKINFLGVHRNLFLQLSRDGNLHGSGVSYAMTASPEPFLGVPWRMDETVVGRGNAE